MAKKDLIYSDQFAMFGSKEIIGFGSDEFSIKELDRNKANKIIVENHYSKKFYNATYIHLGVYIKTELVGVLQFGYAMNPASCGSVVEGTELDQYLELNRMWLDDKAPRNSESMAISYAVRYIRSKFNKIKWIQSFADERCGGFGIVYQGANFDFYGEHIAKFWTLDNEVYHNSLMTRNPKLSKSAAYLQHHKERATSEELRQFRYIYWIDHKWKKKVLLKQKPYPKHYAEKPNNFEKVEAGGLFLNSFQTEFVKPVKNNIMPNIDTELPPIDKIVKAKCKRINGSIEEFNIRRIISKETNQGWHWSHAEIKTFFTLEVLSFEYF